MTTAGITAGTSEKDTIGVIDKKNCQSVIQPIDPLESPPTKFQAINGTENIQRCTKRQKNHVLTMLQIMHCFVVS
jgi:hypothetical protein